MSVNSRKCGVCEVRGHTVRTCSDVSAAVAIAMLMNESSLDRALVMCRNLPTGYVSFALCHGFGVSVSGGRSKLIELINMRLRAPSAVPSEVHPEVPPAVVQPRVLIQPRVLTPPAFVQPTVPVSPYDGLDVRTRLNAMVSDERRRYDGLTATLSSFRRDTMQGHVILRGNLPNQLDDEARLSEQRHIEIERITNKVINMLLADIRASRASGEINAGLINTDSYISGRIANMNVMNDYINAASDESNVILSVHARQYIMTHVMIKDCVRRYNLLIRRIDDYDEIDVHVEPAMKQLKTVVSCRSHEDEAMDSTCSVCFDDVASAQVVKTGCGHDFCVDCIGNWARQRGMKSFIQCPCCRTEIDTLTVGDEAEQVKVEAGLAPV